nr:iron-sulfur cluster assembly scaffold protein [Candidatus Sigynarchaeota archaeon]
MNDDFDRFAKELQDEIDKDVQKHYSPNVLDLIKHQPNYGTMDDASARGTYKDEAGDSMTFFLKINSKNVIEKATYTTTACKHALACGSQVTFLVRNKTVDEAKQIDADTIMKALGRFPPELQRYVDLAERTLKESLKNFTTREKKARM